MLSNRLNRYLPFYAFALLFLNSCVTASFDTYYKVKVMPGDTLISIASRYGTSWYAVSRDNNIRDYRTVKVGNILYIKPGPGGHMAVGEPGNLGFMGEINEKQWQERFLHEQPAMASPEQSPEKADAPRKGLLFGDGEKQSLIWPVNGSVSSEYGPRWGRFHHGLDIRASKGSPIRAAHAGKVVFSGWRGGYGRLIVLQSADKKFSTYYAHCKSIDVDVGDQIDQGEVLGSVGASGKTTGSHLHFEYRTAGGKSIDPGVVLGSPDHLVSSR